MVWLAELLKVDSLHGLLFYAFFIQIAGLKLSVDLLEKERDFYFAKLRDIEVLCQSPEVENLPVSFFRLLIVLMDSILVGNLPFGIFLLPAVCTSCSIYMIFLQCCLPHLTLSICKEYEGI